MDGRDAQRREGGKRERKRERERVTVRRERIGCNGLAKQRNYEKGEEREERPWVEMTCGGGERYMSICGDDWDGRVDGCGVRYV